MKNFLEIIGAIIIIALVAWFFYPTVPLEQYAKLRARALWDPRFENLFGKSWQWHCFDDFSALQKKDKYQQAHKIFADAYARKSPDTRLVRPEAVDALLTISAEILRSLPENTVMITYSDNETYPFWFVQRVENTRPDVLIINRRLWSAPNYREYLWINTPVGSVALQYEFPDTIIDGEVMTNLTHVAHKLAEKYPVFLTGCKIYEFPAESLYDVEPVMAKLYSPQTISDTARAEMLYQLLRKQNWKYLSENPPTQSFEEFRNSRGCEIMPAIFNPILSLHSFRRDSLAQRLINRFEKWSLWNPYFVASRPLLAWQIGDDPRPWIIFINHWIEANPGHWAKPIVENYLKYYTDNRYVERQDSIELAKKAAAKKPIKPTRGKPRKKGLKPH